MWLHVDDPERLLRALDGGPIDAWPPVVRYVDNGNAADLGRLGE